MAIPRLQTSFFEGSETPLELDEYQAFTTSTDQNSKQGADGLGFVLLGLFGEVGSLLSALKKKLRDKDSYVAYHDAVLEELGDTLWYFSNAALRVGLSLSSIAQRVPATLGTWDRENHQTAKTFLDLQREGYKASGPLASDLVERRRQMVNVGYVKDHMGNCEWQPHQPGNASHRFVDELGGRVCVAGDAVGSGGLRGEERFPRRV